MTTKELIFKIIGDNEQFNKSIQETNTRLDDFKKKTEESNKLFGMVAKQAAIATTAIAATGIAAAKMAVDFNAGFATVQTLIPGASKRIKELQDNVLDLSPAVGKSTKDLTDGLYQVISAFGDSADSAKNLELAAKAATAGNATTTDSINLLSAVTKGYGDTSNKAQKKVSDLAFTTVKLGQTDFPQLASSIQRVTAMSSELGVSQEEMFAVFSSGTGVIGGAAEVSTKLAAVYNELQKPSTKLSDAFEKLGVVSGSELIEKFGGLSGAMQALKGVAEETGEPISNLFGSAEAGNLALYAAGKGAQKFATDLEAMKNAVGATDQAFDDATISGPNAFGFQLQQAGLNAKAFAIKIGQELIPSLQWLLTPLFKGAEYLKNLDEQTLKTIVGIGKIVITATSVTAVVMNFKKALDAVKKSMILLKGAFAANPLGAFVVGVTTAIVAIKELCSWLDRAKKKQKELAEENLRASLAAPKEAESVLQLSKAYIELAEKENLTNVEKRNLKVQTEELLKLAPELQGKLSLEEDAYKSNLKVLKDVNSEKIKEIELTIEKAKAEEEALNKTIENNQKHIDHLKETDAYITNWKGTWGKYKNADQIKEEENALQELLDKKKIYAEEIKKNEDLLASLKDSKTALEETEKPKADTEAEAEKNKHAKALQELDIAYNAEKQIIQNRNVSEKKKNEELKKAEENFYKNRIALLEKFHLENLTSGQSFAQSQNEIVGQHNQSILQETEKTNAEILRIENEKQEELKRLEDEKYKKELEALKNISEETEKSVDNEIAIKKQLGEIAGGSEKEKERNALLEKANAIHEKRKELLKEIKDLENSDNPKDKEKINILKEEFEQLGVVENKAIESAGKIEKTFEQMAKTIAAKMQEVGSAIADTFGSVADLAKNIIGNQEEVRRQKTANRLAEIEQEKNARLLEIDNELSEKREQKQIEDSEREEEKREEEYQKRIADYERNLTELEGNFQTETNLEKLKNLEKQIEADRKKKAEEEQRKKEEKEKAKRDKEARKQEIELLNARASAQHAFEVSRIETENAAGSASAQAAQETAKWQKAQAIISLSIKSAIQTAEAVAAFADGNYIGGAMHTAAATMALIQAGVVSGQPLPPGYTVQPLPPAPKPIKFAQGGIVMPSSLGTGITLPNGSSGLVGEAGTPEIILPLNLPNISKFMQAAGVNNNSNSLSYAPSYSITVSQNASEDLGERLIEVLREHDQEALSIIESSKQKYFLGE